MVDVVPFIVSHLNEKPFDMGLRLVEFDEKSPLDLVQILNDVFTSIDGKMKANVRNETDVDRQDRFLSFLSMLRYKDIPAATPTHLSITEGDNADEHRTNSLEKYERWVNGLCKGDKAVIYPILNWCFTLHGKLKKRAYLAPFLMPIEIPPEIAMQEDGLLVQFSESYRELQDEFKEIHKKYDCLKQESEIRGGQALKEEIEYLREERSQLIDRIEALKEKFGGGGSKSGANKSDHAAFLRILDATSALRKEQDEEMRLRDRILEQNHNLSLEEGRLKQMQDRRNALQSISTSSERKTSVDSILEVIQKEVKETTMMVQSDLVGEQRKLQKKLDQLERERLGPTRTEEDLDHVREQVKDLEEEEFRKKNDVHSEKIKSTNSKVVIFKQHANVTASKLKKKKIEVDKKTKQLDFLKETVRNLNASLSDISCGSGNDIKLLDGKVITQEEMNEFASKLREKTRNVEKAQTKIAAMRAETLILERTEQILNDRHENIEDFIKIREEKAGIEGYRETQAKLSDTHEKTEMLGETKGQILEEISQIIKEMAQILDDKKERLKPMVRNLKELRTEHTDLEEKHDIKKGCYDKVEMKLSVERKHIEKECNLLQEEWLAEEKKYHYLKTLSGLVDRNLERVRTEGAWREGKVKFLPDFSSLKELYENKLVQQENLTKQLRKEQRMIRENAEENITQRKMFLDLQELLQLKTKISYEERAKKEDFDESLLNDPEKVGNAEVLTFGISLAKNIG